MENETKKVLKAIHRHCIECIGSEKEIEDCTILKCFLHPYRNEIKEVNAVRTLNTSF